MNNICWSLSSLACTIILGRAEVLFQPHPGATTLVSTEETKLKTVDDFLHFGSVTSNYEKNSNARFCKTSKTIGCLLHGLCMKSTHLAVLKTQRVQACDCFCQPVVWIQDLEALPTTLQAPLEQCHVLSLRLIFNSCWQDRITNLEVLIRAESIDAEAKMLKAQLWWAGHVIWRDDSRIPRQFVYSKFFSGREGHCKCSTGCLKANIPSAGIPQKQLEECAKDRPDWNVVTK